jgi:autotransporter-associated beta strand protein
MNVKKITGSALVIVVVMAALAAQAQIFKTNNSDALNLGTSWVAGTAPGSGDVATWDATVATAANCTNTLGGAVTWGGILVSNPVVAVKVLTNLLAAGTGISVGSAGITLTNSANLWLAPALTATADQNWTIGSGRTLTLGEASRIITIASGNNVTINGAVVFPYEINVPGTLTIPSGSSLTCTVVNGVQSINMSSGAGVVNQTGGTVIVGRTGGTAGSPSASMIIGSGGTYNISGGSLTDNSATSGGRFDIPGSTGTGTLNISGTASVQSQAIYLANGASGTINVTNGTLTVPGGVNFRVGVSAGTGTMNVYGGTVQSGSTMNLPNGAGTGILNVSGGAVNLTGLNVSPSTGPGSVTNSGGVLTVTNNIAFGGNSGTGSGTVELDGGVTVATSITHVNVGTATLNFNGGTLKARAGSGTFLATNTITANVLAGGAVIDTTNFNVTILAPLLNGGGTDGGLIKLGSGSLTIGSAAGTYNGSTIVNGGTLALATTNHTGGSIVVSNNAGLQVVFANATTMNCSSLALGTLGASSGGTNTLNFNLGTGNPTIPVINASSLAATGTVNVAVSGSGFSIGTVHLIQYSGSLAGNDFGFALTFLTGAVGYVTNNASAHFVDLVITALPNLVWRAQVNTNWDINTTANWVDLSTSLTSVYPDGAGVTFNDSASNSVVNLTNTVNPASVTLNNVHSNYVFAGGGRISGATGLTKTGAGMVTMALTNNYNGATVISNGTFVLGVPNAIPGGGGRGSVTLEGKLDLAGFNDSINGLSGNSGIVDNSSANPVLFSIGGGNGVGAFSGLITNSGGALTLNITGGSQQLLSKNGYSGSTTNKGNLQLAYVQSISSAPLTLGGGSLYWVDAAPHTLNNQVTMSGGSAIGAPTNGLTTIANVVNLVGGVGLTCNSDVLLAGGVTNGAVSGLTGMSGSATLTINNAVGDWTGGSFQLNSGTLVLNGGTVIEDGNNFRIQCNVPNGLSYCIITNGASVTLSNSATANFRVGDSGDAAGATNILDLAGTLTVIPQTSPNTGDKFQLDGNAANSPPDVCIANLLPGGVLNVRQVGQANNVSSTFNFNGGILRANTNDFGPTYMTGLSIASVLDGGAIIDDGGYTNITIGQSLQAGGTGIGGLTKQGSGTLILTGQSTYTGNTLVNAGTLAIGAKTTFPTSYGSIAYSSNIVVAPGATFDVTAVVAANSIFDLVSGQTIMGKGSVAGVVTVDSGVTVAPGDFVSTGTLTFTNAPVLSGAVVMRLKKIGVVATNDQLVVASADTLNYDGTLTVTNTGSPLAAGDKFYLFSAAAYSGAFTLTNLPALAAGLGWVTTNLAVDGSIMVTGPVVIVSRPIFTSIVLNNGQLILRGTNGTASMSYRVFGSTNLMQPLSNWTPIVTNSFDGSGGFIFTNAVNPAKPAQFYDISVP